MGSCKLVVLALDLFCIWPFLKPSSWGCFELRCVIWIERETIDKGESGFCFWLNFSSFGKFWKGFSDEMNLAAAVANPAWLWDSLISDFWFLRYESNWDWGRSKLQYGAITDFRESLLYPLFVSPVTDLRQLVTLKGTTCVWFPSIIENWPRAQNNNVSIENIFSAHK